MGLIITNLARLYVVQVQCTTVNNFAQKFKTFVGYVRDNMHLYVLLKIVSTVGNFKYTVLKYTFFLRKDMELKKVSNPTLQLYYSLRSAQLKYNIFQRYNIFFFFYIFCRSRYLIILLIYDIIGRTSVHFATVQVAHDMHINVFTFPTLRLRFNGT